MWDEIAAGLAGERYIIATDQRGHGDSEAAENGYEMEQFAEDLHGVLTQLGQGTVPALGHSSGSTTLLLCEAMHPGTFTKLVLIEPIIPIQGGAFGGGPNPMADRARRRRAQFDSSDAMFESFRDRPPFDGWTDEALWLYAREGTRPQDGAITLKCQPEYEARFYEAIAKLDAGRYLRAITCPVVLVKGEKSEPFRMGMFDRAREVLEAPVEVVAGAGHFVPQEKPNAVIELIRKYLS